MYTYKYIHMYTYIYIYTCKVPIWKSRESKFAKTPKYALFNKNEVTEEMIASLGVHSCIESRSDWEDKVCSSAVCGAVCGAVCSVLCSACCGVGCSVWCSVWCSVCCSVCCCVLQCVLLCVAVCCSALSHGQIGRIQYAVV